MVFKPFQIVTLKIIATAVTQLVSQLMYTY